MEAAPMTRDTIINNILATLKTRQNNAKGVQTREMTFPITFTHEHKEAAGCAIIHVQPDGQYEVKSFDSKYANVEDPWRTIYHAALYDCDEDLDGRESLIDAINDGMQVNS
ncbi:hypothetical protein FC17_GL002974 [Secundilactobacillus paracollinoides DSM 15502 = JCM 11969]|nr:hypothetical protein FC17_GL002974 [Secundilactobacillus paracollinoides DSM 15502 = JCM 11969]